MSTEKSTPPDGVMASHGWRPISTAPRDGSRILLWWKYRPARVGWWTDEESGTGWKCDGDVVVACAAAQSDATHWQPVPGSPGGIATCDAPGEPEEGIELRCCLPQGHEGKHSLLIHPAGVEGTS